MSEDTCPNCITPWKCNGPHLVWISDTIYHSEYGYFLFNTNEWVWLPQEKEYNTDTLFMVTDTLRNLNESNEDYD
jgi:hypothetical protein